MVILLNGASTTGKTTIAQRLLERYFFTYYSIDHIKMGLYRGLSDNKYNPTNKNNVLSKNLSPIIEGIIRTAIENNQNLIIEGCYFDSKSITKLKNEYIDELILISLVMSEKYCKKNYDGVIKKYRNIIENRQYNEDRSIEQFIQENNDVVKFSKDNQFYIFEIIDDFEIMFTEIINFLDEKMNFNAR